MKRLTSKPTLSLGITLVANLALVGCGDANAGDSSVSASDSELVSQEQLELGAGLPEADFTSGALNANQADISLRGFDSSVKGQGNRGWCTAFATVAAIENVARQKLDVHADLSEIDHYQSYRKYEMLASVRTASKIAIAPESSWPYNGNPNANYQAERIAKISAYAAPETREEVLAELAAGHPLVIGISTFRNFDADDSGRVPMPIGRIRGGHAVEVVGFTRDPSYSGGGYLVFKNSWTDSFGDHGYGKLPLDYCKVSSCYFLAIRSISYAGTTTLDAPGATLPPALPAPTTTPPAPTEPTLPVDPSAISDVTVHTVAEHDAGNGANFRLALDGSPALLASIEQVRYDVDASFGNGRYATSTDRTTGFRTATVYRTYDHNWRTRGTEITLVGGRKVNLAGAVITW